MNLETGAKITWCPGCGNFIILSMLKKAINELVENGTKPENIVMVSGIGCHAKIVDYVNVNSFYSIHGRVPPTLTGLKLANPDLVPIGFAGDGDAYGEGISHLIFAAKRNVNVTMIIHNNRIYGLTTGQFSPTTPEGMKTKTTPRGSIEYPLNPIKLMISAGATFVARASTTDMNHLKDMIVEAVNHKGFSIVDVIEPCISFFDSTKYLRENVYKLEDHDPTDEKKAIEKAEEWNYTAEGKIPIGIFYKVNKPTFDELILRGRKLV
ncbi:MAG: 2-oxoacid:ferredoxin oxidoreductase subunit beta [Candidatus Aenigmarchaeota archaeon]|nr:2-oxoacid:ferredoxin oxidoreductase subunit beta [Candidatus Aenigmarchaeota archaeon]